MIHYRYGIRKHVNAKAAMEKVIKIGYKICRFAQFPNEGKKGILCRLF